MINHGAVLKISFSSAYNNLKNIPTITMLAENMGLFSKYTRMISKYLSKSLNYQRNVLKIVSAFMQNIIEIRPTF